jgi:hypothetical protein
VLILERAFQDEDFLAAAVDMAREGAARRIAHDRGGACHLAADAIEHASVDAGRRAFHPVELRRMDDDGLGQVVIDAHRLFLPWSAPS